MRLWSDSNIRASGSGSARADSMIDGRTVQETESKSRSSAEMAELWGFVKARMEKSTKARLEGRLVDEQEARHAVG